VGGGTTFADLAGNSDVHFAQRACQEAVVITQRSRHIQILTLGFLVTAAAGCAANLPETRQGRAAGEWQFHLPTTRSPIGGLAFGRGGSAVPADRAVTNEQPNQPLMAAAVPAKSTARTQRVRHMQAAPIVPAPAPVNTDGDNREPPAVAPTTAPAPVQLAQAEPTSEQRYGQREARSPKLEQFRGGDAVVVISASALLVVLLIVILILLLR
jgi:hypothetical protein